MHSKKFRRRVLPIAMAAIMVASCFPAMAATDDPWSISDAKVTKEEYFFNDGETKSILKATVYEDYYLKNTGNLQKTDTLDEFENAKVAVIVPEGATENSPIFYAVNNSGWLMNGYSDLLKDGGSYAATNEGQSDQAAYALSKGYIVVNAGLRTRQDGNQSPVTVADAKAVIRYLRYNNIGNTDLIFISGTSGGGALSSAIGANGNSTDFYEELYKIGAAGMTDAKTSTINDDVYGVVAYCPITDLGHSDGSYEFAYASTRVALADAITEAGGDLETVFDKSPVAPVLAENGFPVNGTSTTVSPLLAEEWADYVDSFGLKYDGKVVTADFDTTTRTASGTFVDVEKDLLIACLQKALDKYGYEEFMKTLTARDGDAKYGAGVEGVALDTDWLTLSADNKKVEDIDLVGYAYYVGAGQFLKGAPAFTNSGIDLTIDPSYGIFGIQYNENNLFAVGDDTVGFLSEHVFNLSSSFKAEYGDWNTYWTNNKSVLTAQSRMVDSIAYLVDEEGTDKGDTAPYWYARHGFVDRDTSFANQTLYYLALENNDDIKTLDFQFAWDRAHEGSYDLKEGQAFMDAAVKAYNDANPQPTTPPATDDGTSPKTGAASGMLPMVIASIAAVAGASVRGRKIR